MHCRLQVLTSHLCFLWSSNFQQEQQEGKYNDDFKKQKVCFSCGPEPQKAVNAAHLQVKKGAHGNLVTPKIQQAFRPLTPASINKDSRRTRQREREAGQVISSTLHPGHLTLLLIVCFNKGGRQRWCCSIDRLVMEAMKGPRCSVNGTVRMFLQDDCVRGEETKAGVQTHLHFSHASGMHEYTSAPVLTNLLS